MVPKPLPSVLIIHTGGTLGMDPIASYEPDVDGKERLKGGGTFKGTLGPGIHLCPCSLIFAVMCCCMSHLSCGSDGIVLQWQALHPKLLHAAFKQRLVCLIMQSLKHSEASHCVQTPVMDMAGVNCL